MDQQRNKNETVVRFLFIVSRIVCVCQFFVYSFSSFSILFFVMYGGRASKRELYIKVIIHTSR